MPNRQDLVVVGGGAGGLSVASAASQLGLRVTLIERHDKLGGDCLHYGCVPSKTLIQSAKVVHQMRHADEFGLTSFEPEVDLRKVNSHVRAVINKIQKHDDPDRFRSYGCDVIFGQGSFVGPQTIEVNGKRINSKRFVLATGSSPAVPPIPGLAQAGYITNESVFNLDNLPKRLLVMGAGPIGLELAQAFSRFGTQVTVVEMQDNLLGMLDQEVASRLQQILVDEKVHFHLSTKVNKVSQGEDCKIVICETSDGSKLNFEVDEILVATGRSPNVEELNLDQADVEYTPRGISVDNRLRTSSKRIFAVGDVVDSPYKFTHIAEYHAGIVIANAVFHIPRKIDLRVIPAVIYTDPEFAAVGLTLQQVRSQGIEPKVLEFDFKDIDRALAENEFRGMAKIIVHKNRILGASLLGPQAGELLSEIVLAMQANIKISKISAAIHAYPTLAQINRRVINTYYGEKLFSPRVKRIVSCLNKIFR